MKILLTGKNGQVGFELQRSLAPLGELIALDRSQANLEDLTGLQKTLEAHRPDIIVNAAAYTHVDKAESDEAAAYNVNARAVHALADYARAHDAFLVHYSTDYVFDGEKSAPYVESDPTHPQNAYGRSKLAGEEAILQSHCKALIFRTSWVFSTHGNNFIKTIVKLIQERDSLDVVSDQVGAPTSAEFIATITARAIAGYPAQALPLGLYHLAAAGETNWYGLACHVLDQLRHHSSQLPIQTTKIHPITSKDYPTLAKRPGNSRLDTRKLSHALGLTLPDWTTHVDQMLQQTTRPNRSRR